MKKIILDHFQRWRFVLIAIGIAYFLFEGFFTRGEVGETSPTDALPLLHQTVFTIFIFQFIVFLGFVLIYDLQRGIARVLITLPVTTKQIGRALWFASVGIPALALTIIGFIAILIFSIGTTKTISPANYLISCIFAAPTLGAVFGAITFTTTWIVPVTFTDRIRLFFSNLIFMLPLIGFIFIDGKTPTLTETILLFLALTVLSIIGWFRAERLVVNRASFRLAPPQPRKQAAQYKTPAGFGGLPFLITKTTGQAFLMYLFLAAIITVIPIFSLHGQPTFQKSMETNAGGFNFMMFSVWAVGIFQIFPMFIQLRLLRTLPISTARLAALLVFPPIISFALFSIVIGVFLFPFAGQAKALEVVATFLIPMTMTSIGISLITWFGLERNTLALIAFCFFIAIGVAPLWLNLEKIPLSFRCVADVLLVLISFFMTKFSLARSSKAYRINLQNLGTWAGRRW